MTFSAWQAMRGVARLGRVWLGNSWQARHGAVSRVEARCGLVGQARRGQARRGWAGHGSEWLGRHGINQIRRAEMNKTTAPARRMRRTELARAAA